MKPPLLLKGILDFCFIIMVILYVSSIISALYLLLAGSGMPIKINDHPVDEIDLTSGIFLTISQLISGVFVYVIYLLRKLVRSFFKNRFFTRIQISLFNLIGQLILLNTVAELVMDILSNIFLGLVPQVHLQFVTSFDGFLFKLAIGLFFIYLGKLFDNAKQLREENELTV